MPRGQTGGWEGTWGFGWGEGHTGDMIGVGMLYFWIKSL